MVSFFVLFYFLINFFTEYISVILITTPTSSELLSRYYQCSSIVNEVIRGNLTSMNTIRKIKKIRKIKRIKRTKIIKNIKTLNKQPYLDVFYARKRQKRIKSIKTLNKQPLLRCFLYA